MTQYQNSKQYDLEERTYNFAVACRVLVKELPKTTASLEDGKQLIRSSGSIAANYIEANESLSKKDFLLRLRIARKEAKETVLWLRLLGANEKLIDEASQIKKILSTIIDKSV